MAKHKGKIAPVNEGQSSAVSNWYLGSFCCGTEGLISYFDKLVFTQATSAKPKSLLAKRRPQQTTNFLTYQLVWYQLQQCQGEDNFN